MDNTIIKLNAPKTNCKTQVFNLAPLADLPLLTTNEQISYELEEQTEHLTSKRFPSMTALRVIIVFLGAYLNQEEKAVGPTDRPTGDVGS